MRETVLNPGIHPPILIVHIDERADILLSLGSLLHAMRRPVDIPCGRAEEVHAISSTQY